MIQHPCHKPSEDGENLTSTLLLLMPKEKITRIVLRHTVQIHILHGPGETLLAADMGLEEAEDASKYQQQTQCYSSIVDDSRHYRYINIGYR